MRRFVICAGAVAWVTAAPAWAHEGPRVWIDQTSGMITTWTSDNDLSPTTYTPSRVFSTDLERLFNIWLSEFPGYEVKRTDASVAEDTTFGFSIAGPLLVFDSTDQVYRTTSSMYTPAPQMGVVFGASIVTTGSGPAPGVDFFNYQETGDHAHLTYAMFGNGTGPSDGPPAVYALPLRLTSASLTTSRTYYLLIGNQVGVGSAALSIAQQSLAGPVGVSWDATTGGAWQTAANWDASVPDSVGAAVILGDRITSNATVTLDVSRHVGRLTFDSPHSYVLNGATISLADPTGTGTIQVRTGQHAIHAPLAVVGNAVIDISPADAVLTFPGSIQQGTSTRVLKRGGGTFEIGRLGLATLSIEQGCVRVLPSGPFPTIDRLASLHIGGSADAWVGQLDLTNNDLEIHYTGISPITTITNQLRNGRNGGAWDGNGIASSLAGGSVALGVRDDGDKILIKFTYTGDANLDGQVDISDLALLATSWQTPASWSGGDFNYDGMVDISDLASLATNWQAGVGSAPAMSFEQAAKAVGLSMPEPGLGGLLLLGLLLRRRMPPAGVEPARPLPGRGF